MKQFVSEKMIFVCACHYLVFQNYEESVNAIPITRILKRFSADEQQKDLKRHHKQGYLKIFSAKTSKYRCHKGKLNRLDQMQHTVFPIQVGTNCKLRELIDFYAVHFRPFKIAHFAPQYFPNLPQPVSQIWNRLTISVRYKKVRIKTASFLLLKLGKLRILAYNNISKAYIIKVLNGKSCHCVNFKGSVGHSGFLSL